MLVSDWSSDVCSSDLDACRGTGLTTEIGVELGREARATAGVAGALAAIEREEAGIEHVEIGRASCRGRGEGRGTARAREGRADGADEVPARGDYRHDK